MRHAEPLRPPTCLTIAGSDSGGGAGIQADLKAMESVGAFGMSAITAVTAQNTRGVDRSFILPLEVIEAQIEAVRSDIAIDAVKTGMLATSDVINLVAEEFADATIPLVIDPVMIATSGDLLLDESAEAAYPNLISNATIVTPNIDEASALTAISIDDRSTAVQAGEALIEMGAEAALVKGGHLSADPIVDILVTDESVHEFHHPRVDSQATHGSGCTLASMTAAHLANGEEIVDAVATSLDAMDRAIRFPIGIGEGPGSVQHLAALRNEAARGATFESVHEIVNTLVRADIDQLIPEVGMNVVGVTPFAEAPRDTAAVDGRITRTSMDIRPNAGIAFGASSHVADIVFAVRERYPNVRFGLNIRMHEEVDTILESFDWVVAEIDRGEEVREPEMSMEERVLELLAAKDIAPGGLLDRGSHGNEPMLILLATDPVALRERTLAIADAYGEY